MGFRRKYLMPRGRLFDRVEHWLSFVKTHRRLPVRGRLLLNDLIYEQMTNGRMADPLVQMTSDKALLKGHVDEVLGPGHVIPTRAILRSAEEIAAHDFVPGSFVKPTHLSGRVAPIRSAADVDREMFAGWLRRNYYHSNREQQYRFLTPGILVEPFVFDGAPFREMKFYVLKGRSRLGFEVTEQGPGRAFVQFDRSLATRPYDTRCPVPARLDPPGCMAEMWAAAERLGAPFDFVRVDMMTDGARFVVNELTHSEGAGRYPFRSRRRPYLACEHELSRVLVGDGGLAQDAAT